MFNRFKLGFCLAIAMAYAQPSKADFELTLAAYPILENSGVVELDFFVSSASNVQFDAMDITFTLPSGTTWVLPNGDLSFASVNLGVVNTVTPDWTDLGGQSRRAGWSFESLATTPSSAVQFGTILFDIGSLSPGTYNVAYDVSSFNTATLTPAGAQGTASFSVVPEPSSLALVGLVAGTVCLRRRRRAECVG